MEIITLLVCAFFAIGYLLCVVKFFSALANGTTNQRLFYGFGCLLLFGCIIGWFNVDKEKEN
mgnify:CR=1 FL=1